MIGLQVSWSNIVYTCRRLIDLSLCSLIAGDFILAASQDADCVEVLKIDAATGALERVDTQVRFSEIFNWFSTDFQLLFDCFATDLS